MVVNSGELITSILCEDVRRELGNKRTLVGVFAGDILVPTFPALLNFGVYLEFVPFQTGRLDFTLEIYVGGVKVLGAVGQMLVSEPKSPAIIDIPKVTAQIIEPVEVRIDASFAGNPVQTIMSKRVIQGEGDPLMFPTSPWPPSSQSPPSAHSSGS